MLPFTPTEAALMKNLPKPVQQLLLRYPSVAENYARGSSLPLLSQGYQFQFFEIYYDCQELPVFQVENGNLRLVARVDPNHTPQVIEMVGDDDVVFIQVGNHVILNRTNGNLPDVRAVLVEV